MIRVIDRVRYNTETATLLATNAFQDGSNRYQHGHLAELYRTQGGRYFIAHFTLWQGEHDSIEPLSAAEAERMYGNLYRKEVGYEEAFPGVEVEDADAPLGRPPMDPEGKRVSISVALPTAAHVKLQQLSKQLSISRSEIVNRAIMAYEPEEGE